MSILRRIRKALEMRKMKKALKKSMEEFEEKQKKALSLSVDALSALPDEDLILAVIARIENIIEKYDDWESGVNSLNRSRKVVYSLNWLESEVNNGGLCQFFVNSSRMVAPFVSDYLETVGAHEHKKLYDGFVEKYRIDLTDLSFFDVEKAEEFAEKAEAYPFDEYDDAFYGMEPIETHLIKFVREHIEDY